MIRESLLEGIVGRTIVIAGIVGLSYFAGYETKNHYAKIELAKQKILSYVSIISPEEHVRQNIGLYKKELLSNPDKYRKHIVDISVYGTTKFSTDVFVLSVRKGVDYLKNRYDAEKELIAPNKESKENIQRGG